MPQTANSASAQPGDASPQVQNQQAWYRMRFTERGQHVPTCFTKGESNGTTPAAA
jgi:hypothetical protein